MRPYLAPLLLALLLPALALAHSERYLDPVPIPKGGPGSARTPTSKPRAATDSPGASDEPTAEIRREHWRIWWRLNRERILKPNALLARRADAADEGREELIAALRTAALDPEATVASSAVISLGRVRDAASQELFIGILADRTRAATVLEAAALALGLAGGEVRGTLGQVMADADHAEGTRAFAALGMGFLGDPAALTMLLGTDPDLPRAEMLIATGILGEGMAASDLARIAAKGETPLLRTMAVAGLGKLLSPQAVPSLILALDSAFVDVRRQAALSIGGVAEGEDAKVVAVLRTALAGDADLVVRAHASVTLGELGGEADLTRLLKLYRTGEKELAPYAVTGAALLCRRFPESESCGKARRTIRFQLSEGMGPELASALATATALAGDKEAEAVLRGVLAGATDPGVRGCAAVALGVLGAKDSADAIRAVLASARHPGLIQEAALGLGLLDREAAETVLLTLLADAENESGRAAAALALGRLAGSPGTAALAKLLGDRDQPAPVRGAAATALGWYLTRSHWPHLALIGDRLSHHLITPALATAMNLR